LHNFSRLWDFSRIRETGPRSASQHRCTRGRTAAVLKDPKATRLVIRIEDKDFDLTALYGITPAKIRENADKFVIHFGRIAQPSVDGEPR